MTAPRRRTPPADEPLRRELERIVDRLRTIAVDRLTAPAPPFPSRAEGARVTATVLAGLTARLEDPAGTDPRRRTLPALADRASADLVAVTGEDLLLALGAAGEGDVDDVRARALEALSTLRRAV